MRNASGCNVTELPVKLYLEIADAEVAAELSRYEEGPERETFAGGAVRLGVLAIRQARGELDADAIRREGERLLERVRVVLTDHATKVCGDIGTSLRQFLDPHSGVLPQRLESLIRRDGELDAVLARHLSGAGSELARTLAQHVGEQSALFRLLSPTQADGVVVALAGIVQEALDRQRAGIAGEFSLDEPGSALSRLVREILTSNGQLKTDLQTDFDGLVRQFSLDDPESALSRLVRQVDHASGSIAEQFSLDLDGSSLNRMRRELLEAVQGISRSQTDFHAEVRATLLAFTTRRQEAARSTRHGGEFETAVCETLGAEVRRLGDHFLECGTTPGRRRACKKGDAVAILGPDSAAAGERVVIEAKAARGFDTALALAELEQARDNREAQVGIFVFARDAAPAGVEPLGRFGSDLLVIWDQEEPATDIYLRVAYSLARALVTTRARDAAATAADLVMIDKALYEIRKRLAMLDDIVASATTIRRAGEKIERNAGAVRAALEEQLETLDASVAALRQAG